MDKGIKLSYLQVIIIGLAIALVFGGGGFFAGKKIALPDIPPIDSRVVDSLLNVTKTLEDSIMVVKKQREEGQKITIKHLTHYDTIRVSHEPKKILQDLRGVAMVPIE